MEVIGKLDTTEGFTVDGVNVDKNALDSVSKMDKFGDKDIFRKMFPTSTGASSLLADGTLQISAININSIWQPVVGDAQEGVWTFQFSDYSNSAPAVGFYSAIDKAVYCSLYPSNNVKTNGRIRFTGRNGANNWMPNQGGLGVDKDGLGWNPVGLSDQIDMTKSNGIRACSYKNFLHTSHLDSEGRPYRSIGYKDDNISTILSTGVQGVGIYPNTSGSSGKAMKVKSYEHQTIPRGGLKHVVFLGDSQVNMMSNWSGADSGAPLYAAREIFPNKSWAAECSKKLYEQGYITSNTAVPGEQYFQIEAGIKGNVPNPNLGTIPLFNFNTLLHPEMENIVVLSAGVNGFIIGKKTVQQVSAEFDSLVDTIVGHGSVNRLIVTTVAPANTEWDTGWTTGEVNKRIRELNDHIRNTAKTKAYQVFDLYNLVVDPDNIEKAKTGWVGKDKLHYDQPAVDAIADNITPLIIRESVPTQTSKKSSGGSGGSSVSPSESLWSGNLSATGAANGIKLSRMPNAGRNLLMVGRAAMSNGTNELFITATIPVNNLKAGLTIPVQGFYPNVNNGTLTSIVDIWVTYSANDTVHLTINQRRGWQVSELVEIVEIP